MSGWPTRLVVATALSALWAVVTPGTEFGYHLLLLVFPLGWVIGLGLQSIVNNAADPRMLYRLPAIAAVIFILDLVMTDNLFMAYGKRLLDEHWPGSVASLDPR